MTVLGFANGCFDGMHLGHQHFLRECVMNCDRLVVALNTDEDVARLKTAPPRHPLRRRASDVFDQMRPGDLLTSFAGEAALKQLILDLGVTILFKGEDYYGREATGQALVRRVHYVARHPGYVSTGASWPVPGTVVEVPTGKSVLDTLRDYEAAQRRPPTWLSTTEPLGSKSNPTR